MRFWRPINPDPKIAMMLISWFVPENQTREDIYLELRHRLTYNSEETFVCILIEGNLVMGMGIAYCRYKDVFIWQVHSRKGVPRYIIDMALDGMCHWAKTKGFDRVTAIPNRARRIWEKRWGFRESEENKDEVFLEI